MTGAYGVSTWTAIIAATGVILSAVYALTLYRRVVFGELTNPELATIADLDWREVVIFAPLIVGTLALGLLARPGVQPDPGVGRRALVDAYHAAIGG